jgi:DNA-binding MarR family transcriptional regulator
VTREPNAEDARSLLVQLTSTGLALIEQVVEAHIENERRILSALPTAALANLDAALPRCSRRWKARPATAD